MIENFLNSIRNVFAVPDLRKRVLFTLGMLAVYRVGSHVRVPGVDPAKLAELWQTVASSLLGVLDLFSGGNLQKISIFALGIMPYITASIILQLMTVVSPRLKAIQEEGEILSRIRRGQRIEHYETVRVAKDGHRIDIWLSISPVRDARGRITGASKIARDITGRRQAEKQYQQLLVREQAARGAGRS